MPSCQVQFFNTIAWEGVQMSRQNDVARLISEINRCEEERNAALQQYAQNLHELKLELARVCGHERITHEWAWTRCLDCGAVELTAMFAAFRRRGVAARAAEITAW